MTGVLIKERRETEMHKENTIYDNEAEVEVLQLPTTDCWLPPEARKR